MLLRPYYRADYDAVIDICRRTGAGGQDATDRLQHPELMGLVWAAPYVIFEPEHALVIADDAAQVVGYALGTGNTVAFEDRLAARWWPQLQKDYPRQLADAAPTGFLDAALSRRIHNAPRTSQELTDKWPAHVHIDLLPVVQGQGMGRKTMTALLTSCARRAPEASTWEWIRPTRARSPSMSALVMSVSRRIVRC